MLTQGHRVRGRPLLAGIDQVAGKRGPAADDLVAGVENRLAQHVDAPVGPGADADLLEGDAVVLGQRGVQGVRTPVRVAVQLSGAALDRLEGSGKRAERPFVRRELHDPREPELPLHILDGLPGLVRRQALDAGPEERLAGIEGRSAHRRDPIAVPRRPMRDLRLGQGVPGLLPTAIVSFDT